MGSTSSRRWIECPFHLHWNALSLPCPVVRKKTAHPDQLRQFKQGQPLEVFAWETLQNKI